MTPIATSTFLQVLFAAMIIVPVVILWVAAVVDVIRHGGSGLKIAGTLVLILVVPILGPLLYFAFRHVEPTSAEDRYMAEADLRREAARRPVGGSGTYG
ncbi:MAG TPA: PLD nuclease N-terminal domain-containing protein [Solirubrobacteraceae bacterium]|nr:PLD nuclease N-terminal domain-containing protein [Solirubrobacteraceae bacterium]